MAIDYNAINFKNKDVDRFASKFGNGDPKKKKDAAPDNTFSASPTVPKFETVAPKSTEKDWRERSQVGAVLHGTPVPHKARGAKKNMDMGGNKSKICIDKPGQKQQDQDCRNPNAK